MGSIALENAADLGRDFCVGPRWDFDPAQPEYGVAVWDYAVARGVGGGIAVDIFVWDSGCWDVAGDVEHRAA